jgi:hypothetical protein
MLRRLVSILLFGAAVTLVFAGCTITAKPTVAQRENLLEAAGFEIKAADTPEKIEKLKALPQRKFIRQEVAGKLYYLYADASHCQCLYKGTEKEHRAYKQLAREHKMEYKEDLYEQQGEDRGPALDLDGLVDQW